MKVQVRTHFPQWSNESDHRDHTGGPGQSSNGRKTALPEKYPDPLAKRELSPIDHKPCCWPCVPSGKTAAAEPRT